MYEHYTMSDIHKEEINEEEINEEEINEEEIDIDLSDTDFDNKNVTGVVDNNDSIGNSSHSIDHNNSDYLNTNYRPTGLSTNSLNSISESNNMNKITFSSLMNERKNTLFNKLNKIESRMILYENKECLIYRCSDLVNTLSKSPISDMTYISKQKIGVVKREVIVNNSVRLCVYITEEGIKNYLYNCNVNNYSLACEYFRIPLVNKQYVIWQKELEKIKMHHTYKTSSLLYWLYGKRKRMSILGEWCELKNLIERVKDDASVDRGKLAYLCTLK